MPCRARAGRARVSRLWRARSRGEGEADRGKRKRGTERRRPREGARSLGKRLATPACRVAASRADPDGDHQADATDRSDAAGQADSSGAWWMVAPRRRGGRDCRGSPRREAQVPAARADESEHLPLDVRVLRRVLVGVRLAVGVRHRDLDLHSRDGSRGDAAASRDRGRGAAVHSRRRGVRHAQAARRRPGEGRADRPCRFPCGDLARPSPR